MGLYVLMRSSRRAVMAISNVHLPEHSVGAHIVRAEDRGTVHLQSGREDSGRRVHRPQVKGGQHACHGCWGRC
eukprot:27597-Chlamydomonas_euryale.AAC.4